MLTKLVGKTIVRVAKRGGKYGRTFPDTWAKVRIACNKLEVEICHFDMIEGKRIAKNAWHAGRAEAGLMPVDLY